MKQYIDFFGQSRSALDAACAPLLNARREEAFARFLEKGFPAYGSENYRHTNVAALLKADFGFYLTPSERTVDPRRMFPCTIPDLHSSKQYIVNGWLYNEGAADAETPADVFSGSLNAFAEQQPELFSAYFNRLAGEKGEGLAAFNTAFVQDGYVLYIPKDTEVEKLFQLTDISGGKGASLTNRRILVIVEPEARAQLLACDHVSGDLSEPAATQVVEIYVGEGASFDFYEMEESSRRTTRLAATFAEQAAASTLILHTLTLNNGITRNDYYVDLNGPDASLQLNGLAIADQHQCIDNFTQIEHKSPQCRSSELFKYVLDEAACGVFSGKIVVDPKAQQTNAYQTNRNLLGSRECRMYSKPQLEIYADDVKCSHGMTTGRLDENALFYLRSRGIPEEEAALLLKFAFTTDVLQSIRIESLQERLKWLIDKRFRGESIKCQGCI
jgi:Fe-S cluster assembly protein SufD